MTDSTTKARLAAAKAGEHLLPAPGVLGAPLHTFDAAALRELLILAACPVVCRGYLDGGENWHQLCLNKADSAMSALGVTEL